MLCVPAVKAGQLRHLYQISDIDIYRSRAQNARSISIRWFLNTPLEALHSPFGIHRGNPVINDEIRLSVSLYIVVGSMINRLKRS